MMRRAIYAVALPSLGGAAKDTPRADRGARGGTVWSPSPAGKDTDRAPEPPVNAALKSESGLLALLILVELEFSRVLSSVPLSAAASL
jgi:hypothetical protein